MKRFRLGLTLSLLAAFIFLGSSASLVSADGFIAVHDPQTPAGLFPLEIKYHHVKVRINGSTAVTTVDQEFFNPTGRRLEGAYLFPVPTDAIIKKFTMNINGKETEAEMLDASKARQIYEDIVRRQKDPALLEYSGQSAFKVRIFPIEPQSSKKITLSYQETLTPDNGTYEYVYPLNTEKFSSKNIGNVSVEVDLQTSENLKTVYCSSHSAEITRSDEKRARVVWEARNTKPDRDFKISYNTAASPFGLSFTTYKEKSGDGFYLGAISPDFALRPQDISGKDICFVLDTSGSMAGAKLEQAKKALLYCIHHLNAGDRFQIIRFSTETDVLFNQLMSVDRKNIGAAEKFIGSMNAIGGTNIEEALIQALSCRTDSRKSRCVILITDGHPTVGETEEDRLIDKLKSFNRDNNRIFTFGMGFDINTHLLDKMTEQTKGYRSYVTPEQDLEIEVSNFYTKIQSPVLTDIRLEFQGGVKVFKTYPEELPDLFQGGTLTILGQYRGRGPVKAVLIGKVGGIERRFEYNLRFPDKDLKNGHIPVLWAARRVGYILDQIRLHGSEPELINEVTILARQYGIITPYTSYLILEDEQRRVSRNELSGQFQTIPNIVAEDQRFIVKTKEEFNKLDQKTGSGSVEASREIQNMITAASPVQSSPGQERLYFQDKKGRERNAGDCARFIQGRAFYFTGEWWLDSALQKMRESGKIRILFGSPEYFDLLRQNPDAAPILALGRNIRFLMNSRIIEIYE